MDDLKRYIKDILGIEIQAKPLKPEKIKHLPAFIANEYDFQLIKLYNKDILLVFVNTNFTTDKLNKHLNIVKDTFNTTTVAVIKQMESYNRLRLIEKKVPFIMPGKQMFMPDLLIDLKDFGIKNIEFPQVMQPAAQFLLLFHLQVESLEGINLQSIAKKLNYNSMTITRAAYYLHNTNLCTIEGTKEKFLHFEKNKKDLWKKAEPLMRSPVKKEIYYSGYRPDNNIYKSNINALAHYTDINDDIIEYNAVRPGYTIFFNELQTMKKTGIQDGNICIEEWKYDPYLLSKNKYVDPLSLYLCFRNKPDERIEMALEQLINEIKW